MAAPATPAKAPNWQISITGRSTGRGPDGKEFVAAHAPVAIRFSDGRKTYVHTVVRDGQTSTIASRYSRFVWLDHEVRRAYKGNHLLSNVPKLPKKKWKALVDHTSEQFLNERQEGLHQYLQKLVRVPGIQNVEAVEIFLTTDKTPEPKRGGSANPAAARNGSESEASPAPAVATDSGAEEPEPPKPKKEKAADKAPAKEAAAAAARPEPAASPAPARTASPVPAASPAPAAAAPAGSKPRGPLVASYLSRQAEKNKAWKRRWFALSAKGALSYYESEEDTTERGSMVIDGRCTVKELASSGAGRPHAFQLTTPDRPYVFAADSAGDLAKWLAALGKFAKVVKDDADSGYDNFV